MKKNKRPKEKNKKDEVLDYAKIKKDVKQSFYDYDKIFFNLMTALNKCETEKELTHFTKSLADTFNDAPDELLSYLTESIKNKMMRISTREELDLSKLRAISNNHF